MDVGGREVNYSQNWPQVAFIRIFHLILSLLCVGNVIEMARFQGKKRLYDLDHLYTINFYCIFKLLKLGAGEIAQQ